VDDSVEVEVKII